MANKNNKFNKKNISSELARTRNHNDRCYLDDLNHISKLAIKDNSKRDWIETTMIQLRNKANRYELIFASYLMDKKIKFIHQAPFIFSGKIYFADFYIPDINYIIEIDGNYHNGLSQKEYDIFRDSCFNGNMINVIRIPNNSVENKNELDIICNKIISKYKSKKKLNKIGSK